MNVDLFIFPVFPHHLFSEPSDHLYLTRTFMPEWELASAEDTTRMRCRVRICFGLLYSIKIVYVPLTLELALNYVLHLFLSRVCGAVLVWLAKLGGEWQKIIEATWMKSLKIVLALYFETKIVLHNYRNNNLYRAIIVRQFETDSDPSSLI